MADLALEISK